MKYKILILLVVTMLSCNTNRKRKVLGATPFQLELNAKFKDASRSPLTKKDLKEFKSLDFFEVDDNFKVLAKLSLTPNAPIIEFPTTTERIAYYKRYGILTFKIKEQVFKLAVYKDEFPKEEYKNNLFLPFLDLTNGNTSYEGGRFIDLLVTDVKNNTLEIDFNKAYNPYCAYSNRYTCPITPRENFLNIEIKAGVKAYKK